MCDYMPIICNLCKNPKSKKIIQIWVCKKCMEDIEAYIELKKLIEKEPFFKTIYKEFRRALKKSKKTQILRPDKILKVI